MSAIKILFLGDVMGSSGRKAIAQWLPEIVAEHNPELIVANAENAAHGFGLTPSIARELFSMGIHVLTGGNHSWDKKEIFQCFQEFPIGSCAQRITRRALRVEVLPSSVVERGIELVINLMGRVFMDPIDCPFQAFRKEIAPLRAETHLILIDIHAETTSEKEALAWVADGQVSAIVGTHTHVQTADERILPQGTGFLTDVGMNGPVESVIGMKKEIIMDRFTKKIPIRMEVAEGPGFLHAVIFSINSVDGKCTNVERIRKTP